MKNVLVIVSADLEWRFVREYYRHVRPSASPLGEWFEQRIGGQNVIFFHGGWGKIAAAASAAYGISRWQPVVLFNLGTCGGFGAGPGGGRIQQGEVLLAERTVVYDIIEQMGDPQAALQAYTTEIDLSWLAGDGQPVRRGTLVSADRDLDPQDIPSLESRYGALAADWESGAIAWTAARYGLPVVILRGVSDVVEAQGSPAYGHIALFEEACRDVMQALLEAFPAWLAACSVVLK